MDRRWAVLSHLCSTSLSARRPTGRTVKSLSIAGTLHAEGTATPRAAGPRVTPRPAWLMVAAKNCPPTLTRSLPRPLVPDPITTAPTHGTHLFRRSEHGDKSLGNSGDGLPVDDVAGLPVEHRVRRSPAVAGDHRQ